MSQIPSIVAFVASLVSAGTVLVPGAFDKEAPARIVPDNSPTGPGISGRSVEPMRIQRAPDGLFYVPARVNGVSVRFLLDSGANMVILPRDIASQAGLDSSTGMGRARTVGGMSEFQLSHARKIEASGWTLENVPVAVQLGNTTPPILGMNAMARLGRIVITHDELVFESALKQNAAH